MSNGKLTRKKKSFSNLQNLTFFFPLLFGPLLLSNLITFSFLTHLPQLLVCQMRQEERVKFCLDTEDNRALPLDLGCPDCLSVQSPVGLP